MRQPNPHVNSQIEENIRVTCPTHHERTKRRKKKKKRKDLLEMEEDASQLRSSDKDDRGQLIVQSWMMMIAGVARKHVSVWLSAPFAFGEEIKHIKK